MGNTFGKLFRITTFGESHGKAIGVVVDGCPPNIEITEEDIQKELDKRKPGQSKVTTERKEEDKAHILSGIFNGKTTGHPIAIIIWNKDADSSKYEAIKNIFRPGHADLTYHEKYGIRDYRGGGRSSGRETAARVAAGAIAKKIIGCEVIAYTSQVGNIKSGKIDYNEIENNIVRCPDKDKAEEMVNLIEKTKQEGDSIGGIVEIIVKNPPKSLGDPVFDKLEADLGKALLSIGAVKGVEFGSGFKVAEMKATECNDEFIIKDNKITTKKNNSSGILGGISTGEDITIRIAVKPPSSILKEQDTVTIDKKPTKIKIEGRHDPCICPRIVPVAEAMTAIVLADKFLIQKSLK